MFVKRIFRNKFLQVFSYANKMNTVNCSNSIKHGLKHLPKFDITFKTGDIMLEIATTPFSNTQPEHFSYFTTLFHLFKIGEKLLPLADNN